MISRGRTSGVSGIGKRLPHLNKALALKTAGKSTPHTRNQGKVDRRRTTHAPNRPQLLPGLVPSPSLGSGAWGIFEGNFSEAVKALSPGIRSLAAGSGGSARSRLECWIWNTHSQAVKANGAAEIFGTAELRRKSPSRSSKGRNYDWRLVTDLMFCSRR